MAFLSYLAAFLLAIVPAIVSADNGGVLPWTQWAAGCAAAVALVLTLPAIFSRGRVPLRAFAVAICLLLFAGIAAFQSLTLPPSILPLLASQSARTFAETKEILDSPGTSVMGSTPTSINHSVSVAPWLTKVTAAWFTVLAGFGLAGSQLFVTRSHITMLLVCLAVMGALQSGLGFYQSLLDPSATVWGIKSHFGGAPFGSYIARSSAAVTLNLGMAASLGLIAWRLAAITGASLYSDEFPFSELLDVVFDRVAMIGISCALLSAAGLLACGSRGGLVGTVAGLLLAFGLVQSLHRGRGLVPVLLAVGLMAAILLVNFKLPAKSVDRLQDTPAYVLTDGGIRDGRLDHWQDGWRTAIAQPAVGWGLGTYRYAYLPYQRTSSDVWFINADNLWLEWFVEAGVLGVALAVATLVLLTYCFGLLNASPDPIDHGLATTGWFAVGSMLLSQFFDFGLRLPANSIAATLIAGAVVGRSSMIGSIHSDVDHFRGRLRLSKRFQSMTSWFPSHLSQQMAKLLVAVGFCLALFVALRFLEVEAHADYIRRVAHHLPRGAQFDPDRADSLKFSLQTHVGRHSDDAAALLELSSLTVDSARFRAAHESARDVNSADWLVNYRILSASSLRTLWYQSTAPFGAQHSLGKSPSLSMQPSLKTQPSNLNVGFIQPLFPISTAPESTSNPTTILEAASPATTAELERRRTEFGIELHAARQFACDALRACPLSDEACAAITVLDFAGGSTNQTEQLLSRMFQLRIRNATSLLFVGKLAAQAHLWQLSADAWRSASRLNPSITSVVLASIPEQSPLKTSDVVSENPEATAMAATQELQRRAPDRAWLAHALQLMQRSLPEDRAERVRRLRLIARIHAELREFPIAAKTLGQAVSLAPGEIELRYQYVVALKAAGEIDQARQQARAGRKIAPDDKRFEQVIAEERR